MYDRFKMDAARWVVPQQVADPSQVTPGKMLKLLWRHPPLQAMFWFRLGSWCKKKKIPLTSFIQRLIALVYGMEISVGSDVGGGLYIPHTIGMVIAAKSIGENCSIIHNVTIGMRKEHKFPIIGDNVFIGAGARVLGGIHIGNGAAIGANAVVIQDVPAGMTVVGIPANPVPRKSKITLETKLPVGKKRQEEKISSLS
jgi:serine O-acetyltransferase